MSVPSVEFVNSMKPQRYSFQIFMSFSGVAPPLSKWIYPFFLEFLYRIRSQTSIEAGAARWNELPSLSYLTASHPAFLLLVLEKNLRVVRETVHPFFPPFSPLRLR